MSAGEPNDILADPQKQGNEPEANAADVDLEAKVNKILRAWLWRVITGGGIFCLVLQAGITCVARESLVHENRATMDRFLAAERAESDRVRASLRNAVDGIEPVARDLRAGTFYRQLAAAVVSDQRTIDAAISSARIPVGTVLPFAGDPSDLDGQTWLVCDGRELPRAEYPALANALGAAFGGSSRETLRLPDLRGRVLVGVRPDGPGPSGTTSVRRIGDVGGNEVHVLTVDEIPAHTHKGGNIQHWSDGGNADVTFVRGVAEREVVQFETGVSGGGKPHNNMPPFLTLNFIIKVRY